MQNAIPTGITGSNGRDGRVVECTGLENRRGKKPSWVRIPLPPYHFFPESISRHCIAQPERCYRQTELPVAGFEPAHSFRIRDFKSLASAIPPHRRCHQGCLSRPPSYTRPYPLLSPGQKLESLECLVKPSEAVLHQASSQINFHLFYSQTEVRGRLSCLLH